MSKGHDTFLPLREADPIEQEKLDAGYEFMGWQYTSDTCVDQSHYKDGTVKSQQHSPRASNVTYWCDKCKRVWKIDMSD